MSIVMIVVGLAMIGIAYRIRIGEAIPLGVVMVIGGVLAALGGY